MMGISGLPPCLPSVCSLTDAVAAKGAAPSPAHYLADAVAAKGAAPSPAHYLADAVAAKGAAPSPAHYPAHLVLHSILSGGPVGGDPLCHNARAPPHRRHVAEHPLVIHDRLGCGLARVARTACDVCAGPNIEDRVGVHGRSEDTATLVNIAIFTCE